MSMPPPTEAGCVWITGASSGIGEALAMHLAAQGYRIAASARSAEALRAMAAQALEGRIRPFALDVADREAVAAAVPAIEQACGPIHTAVLNAGTYRPMTIDSFDAVEAQRQIVVNLGGAVNALAPLLAGMLQRQRGHIVLVASLTSRFGLPRAGVYGATKAALVNLGQSLRAECAGRGVVVQVVNPGFVRTPLTDRNDFAMPFLVPVERAAEIMAKAMAGDRFEVAFPWQMALATALLRALPASAAFALTQRLVRR